jgi:hypothetical protein
MNILITLERFSINEVFFLETKENTVMNGTFIKIIYSTPYFTLNTLFLDFPFILNTNVFNGNQYLVFNFTDENNVFIDKFQQIEYEILQQYLEMNESHNLELIKKRPNYMIYKQLKNGIIKYYHYSNNYNLKYYMKISGIWETDKEYGLTFKVIQY